MIKKNENLCFCFDFFYHFWFLFIKKKIKNTGDKRITSLFERKCLIRSSINSSMLWHNILSAYRSAQEWTREHNITSAPYALS